MLRRTWTPHAEQIKTGQEGWVPTCGSPNEEVYNTVVLAKHIKVINAQSREGD